MQKNLSEIEEEVLGIIASVLNNLSSEIKKTDSINDLSHDSIQLFELLVAFEKFYAIEAAYEDVMKLETVGDIVSYVQRVIYNNQD